MRHSRALVSLPAEASTRPSGEVATDRMPLTWPPPLQTMGRGPCTPEAAAIRTTKKRRIPTGRDDGRVGEWGSLLW